jgi:hypothetical protein
VCTHPDRDAIDRAIVGGQVKSGIERQFGLSKDSVRRHESAHLNPSLVKMAEKREERRAASLLDRVEDLYNEAREVLETAKANEQGAVSVTAIRELRATLELVGRLTGELHNSPGTVVNVMSSPDWRMIQAIVLETLAAFPEARAALATRLRELDAPASPFVDGASVERVG